MNPSLIVWLLSVVQLIDYGTMYHGFAVLAPSMATGLGWPVEWVFGVLSASFLLGGIATARVGRWVDRKGAEIVMLVGTLMSALALALCGLLPGRIAFVATVAGIQLVLTLVQYNVAFSLLVQIDPVRAQRNISWLSMVMGLASTIFWPITSALHSVLDWQQVFLVFAAMHVGICLPLLVLLLALVRRAPATGSGPSGDEDPAPAQSGRIEGMVTPAYRLPVSALMIVGFSLQSFVLAAFFIHLLPLFHTLGLGSRAVVLAMLVGPAQFLSRFAVIAIGNRISQLNLAIVSAVLLPVAQVFLLVGLPPAVGATIFAVIFGLGAGLNSIALGTLPLALFGSVGYGARAGHVGSARQIVASAAPFVLAVLMEQAGVDWALAIMTAIGTASVFSFIAIARLLRRQAPETFTSHI